MNPNYRAGNAPGAGTKSSGTGTGGFIAIPRFDGPPLGGGGTAGFNPIPRFPGMKITRGTKKRFAGILKLSPGKGNSKGQPSQRFVAPDKGSQATNDGAKEKQSKDVKVTGQEEKQNMNPVMGNTNSSTEMLGSKEPQCGSFGTKASKPRVDYVIAVRPGIKDQSKSSNENSRDGPSPKFDDRVKDQQSEEENNRTHNFGEGNTSLSPVSRFPSPKPEVSHFGKPKFGMDKTRAHRPVADNIRGPRPLLDNTKMLSSGTSNTDESSPGSYKEGVDNNTSEVSQFGGPRFGMDITKVAENSSGPKPLLDNTKMLSSGMSDTDDPRLGSFKSGLNNTTEASQFRPEASQFGGPRFGMDQTRANRPVADDIRGPRPLLYNAMLSSGMGNTDDLKPGRSKPGLDNTTKAFPFGGPRFEMEKPRPNRPVADNIRGPRPLLDNTDILSSGMSNTAESRPGSFKPGVDYTREVPRFGGPRFGISGNIRGQRPLLDNPKMLSSGVNNIDEYRPRSFKPELDNTTVSRFGDARFGMADNIRGPRPLLDNTDIFSSGMSNTSEPRPGSFKPRVDYTREVPQFGSLRFGISDNIRGPRPLLDSPYVLSTGMNNTDELWPGSFKPGLDNTKESEKRMEVTSAKEPTPLMSLAVSFDPSPAMLSTVKTNQLG